MSSSARHKSRRNKRGHSESECKRDKRHLEDEIDCSGAAPSAQGPPLEAGHKYDINRLRRAGLDLHNLKISYALRRPRCIGFAIARFTANEICEEAAGTERWNKPVLDFTKVEKKGPIKC